MNLKAFIVGIVILAVIIAAVFVVVHEKAVAPAEEQIVLGTENEVVLGVGRKGKVRDVFITLNQILSDSRCSTDVQCIWAGEVKVEAVLERGNTIETRVLSTTEPSTFERMEISIPLVAPAHTSGEIIASSSYQVTFRVNPIPHNAAY